MCLIQLQAVSLSQPHKTGIAGGLMCLTDRDHNKTQRLVCADNNEAHAQTELLAIKITETYSTE